jgi:hypothetical protein
MMKKRDSILTALVLWIACCVISPGAAATGRIDTADQYPVVNSSTLIHVRDQYGRPIVGAAIRITYRPESQVEKTVAAGATNEAGIVRWTPDDVGVVLITAAWMEEDSTEGTASRNISVKFASLPASGIVIMILAGLLLLGGSVIRFARLLREPDNT